MSPWFDPRMLAWYEKGPAFTPSAMCAAVENSAKSGIWPGKVIPNPILGEISLHVPSTWSRKKYTSANRLGGEGVSAGGILIGRAITTRPELFAAAIDKVGLSDTLRFELTQNGETNIPELGSVKTEAGFKALYAMSSYHHVVDGTAYPAVLLETGMNYPRVDPWQMAKMTARLQAASTSGKSVLLRVDYAGGHGAMGATREQENGQMTDEWTFLLWQFGVADFQPTRH